MKKYKVEKSYTKGPFKAIVDDEDREDGYDEIVDVRGIVIARVEGQEEIRRRMNKGKIEGPGNNAAVDSADEVDANARLFAGADGLVEAAIPLTERLQNVEVDQGRNELCITVETAHLRALRDALIKAGVVVEVQEGEQA